MYIVSFILCYAHSLCTASIDISHLAHRKGNCVSSEKWVHLILCPRAPARANTIFSYFFCVLLSVIFELFSPSTLHTFLQCFLSRWNKISTAVVLSTLVNINRKGSTKVRNFLSKLLIIFKIQTFSLNKLFLRYYKLLLWIKIQYLISFIVLKKYTKSCEKVNAMLQFANDKNT